VTDSAAEAVVALSDVVARTGLSADTLRYYEREGLLPPVARSTGGQRRYTQKDLDRLSFLLHLRATGMPVATMRRFAALRLDGEAGRPGRLALLFQHRTSVRRRVADLRRNLQSIDQKIDRHRRILRERGDLPMTSPHPPTGFALLPLHHVQLAIPRGGEDQCRAFWGGVLDMQELAKPRCWPRAVAAGSAAAISRSTSVSRTPSCRPARPTPDSSSRASPRWRAAWKRPVTR